MNPKFAMTPEAVQVILRAVAASEKYKSTVDRAVKRVTETAVDTLKGIITSQNFANVQLSDGYIVRKRRMGLDPRTLIATKRYLDGINVQRISSGVYGIRADMSKAVFAEGAGKRPRKHWEPMIRAMEKAAPSIFAQEVMKELFG